MQSIALIIPYFGKFPNYFQIFLDSCGHNKSIDWLIYSDIQDSYQWPSNVKKIMISFEEFKEKISQVLNKPVTIEAPYKLCDYKPLYGLICSNDLIGYDFWGYCDCDLIFGDIRAFLPDAILQKNSKLFTRGHFTLFHNDEDTSNFYKKQTMFDFNKIISTQKACAFDEWGGVSLAWDKMGFDYFDDLCYDDIRVGYHEMKPTKDCMYGSNPYHRNNIDVSSSYKKMKNILYLYDNGQLYRLWREKFNNQYQIYSEKILYVHLQKRPMICSDSQALLDQGRYLITHESFEPYEKITTENIKRLSHTHVYIKDFLRKLRYILYMMLRKILQ